jgi:hypothetical protein
MVATATPRSSESRHSKEPNGPNPSYFQPNGKRPFTAHEILACRNTSCGSKAGNQPPCTAGESVGPAFSGDGDVVRR